MATEASYCLLYFLSICRLRFPRLTSSAPTWKVDSASLHLVCQLPVRDTDTQAQRSPISLQRSRLGILRVPLFIPRSCFPKKKSLHGNLSVKHALPATTKRARCAIIVVGYSWTPSFWRRIEKVVLIFLCNLAFVSANFCSPTASTTYVISVLKILIDRRTQPWPDSPRSSSHTAVVRLSTSRTPFA
jgi:hypothetical protein